MQRRRMVWVGLVVLLSSTNGCKRDVPAPAEVEAGPRTNDGRFLDDVGKRVLAEIATQETTRDVTCWTSFRQLDNFISSGTYSNFAVLTKIVTIKALLRAVWEKASVGNAGVSLDAASISRIVVAPPPLADDKKQALASFGKDLGLKAYTDYRTTSEHWRVLLSVVTDEIAQSAAGTNLKPLDRGAVEALAESATRLSLLLLQRGGELAREERSPLIEANHVKRAYSSLSKELGLVNVERPVQRLTDKDLTNRLAPLTKTLIDGKIRALQTYNKDSSVLVTDLARVTPKTPASQPAIDIWQKDLQSFSHFVAGGYEPMQADNFLADGKFAPKDQPRQAFVDVPRAENTTMQLFPHVIMPNGDVKLRFEPNPGAPGDKDKPRKGYDELMLDYQQNAVRDTAWHWIILANVYKERAFAMDPFAAEYVSEVVSMMATHYLVRGAEIAKAEKKESIDVDIAKRARDPGYVMVPPQSDEARGWTSEQWKKKEVVLAKYPKTLFQNTTASSGLPTGAPTIAARAGGFDIQEAMGAGIGVGDVNGDGYPDLFMAGEGAGRLYLNKGKEAPGKLVDATSKWGIPAGLDDSHGALFADLDGDGLLDLLVVRSAHPTLVLLQKNGAFVDATEASGLKTHNGAHVAQIFDYDRDGDLDIYISYYGSDVANRKGGKNEPSMDGRNGSPHELWQRGPDGRYIEVGTKAGVADVGWTLATTAFDYDNDGDLDLFLANDFGADTFYQNNGDGTFSDVSKTTDTADRGSGMNATVADVNGDGYFDLYVSNIDMFSKNIKVVYPTDDKTITNIDAKIQSSFQYLSGNKLFMNPADPKGKRPFRPEQAALFEPGDRGWSWSGVFFDYENDGDEDMYLSTGWLDTSFAADQKKQMFIADEGTFYLAPPTSPEAFASNGRCAVAVDLDRDGDLDLVLGNFRQPPAVFTNTQTSKNHWVAVRLRGNGANTHAIGARVTATVGGKKRIRELSAGDGYLGQMDEVLAIGLGTETVDRLSVRWPNGTEETVPAKVDTINELRQTPHR